jgi:hypothetical protein
LIWWAAVFFLNLFKLYREFGDLFLKIAKLVKLITLEKQKFPQFLVEKMNKIRQEKKKKKTLIN